MLADLNMLIPALTCQIIDPDSLISIINDIL